MTQTIKSKIATAAVTGALILSTVMPAFAQTTPVTTRTPRQKIACTVIAAKLDLMVARALVQKNKWDNFKDKGQQMNQRVTAYLQKNNPDQLAQYQSLVNTFLASLEPVRTDAQTFHTDLAKVQSDAHANMCGKSDGQFMSDLNTVKADRQKFKTDAQTARTNFTAIKNFVKGLRSSVTPTPTP